MPFIVTIDAGAERYTTVKPHSHQPACVFTRSTPAATVVVLTVLLYMSWFSRERKYSSRTSHAQLNFTKFELKSLKHLCLRGIVRHLQIDTITLFFFPEVLSTLVEMLKFENWRKIGLRKKKKKQRSIDLELPSNVFHTHDSVHFF